MRGFSTAKRLAVSRMAWRLECKAVEGFTIAILVSSEKGSRRNAGSALPVRQLKVLCAKHKPKLNFLSCLCGSEKIVLAYK